MDQMEDKLSSDGHKTNGNRETREVIEITKRDEHVSGEDTSQAKDRFDDNLNAVLDVLKTSKISKLKAKRIEESLNEMKQLFDKEVNQKIGENMDSALDGIGGNAKKLKTKRNEEKDGLDCNEEKQMLSKMSFDRFSDDLSQLIVGYLPMNDKFRFRCLSKRIQSFIFNRQYVFTLTQEDNLFASLVENKGDRYGIIEDKFEKLVQKLNNLSDIRIDRSLRIGSQVLRIIADNCHHLTRLEMDFSLDISDEIIQYFGQRCGQRLKRLSQQNKWSGETQSQAITKILAKLLSFTSNLIALNVAHLDKDLLLGSNSEILLPKLISIGCKSYTMEAIIAMQNRYSDQLVAVKTEFTSAAMTKEDLFQVISGFGRLTRLQSLEFWPRFRSIANIEVPLLCRQLSQLAKVCPHLRQLDIRFFNPENMGVVPKHNYFSTFKAFTQLTELKIQLSETTFSGSFADFERLSQLKRLTINSNILSDKDLTNIGENLPRLETLNIFTRKLLNNKSLQHIQQLKELKTLEIFCVSNSADSKFTNKALKRLLDNCPKLMKVVLKHRYETRNLRIPTEKIEVFKTVAKEMLRVEYHYLFNTDDPNFYANRFNNCPNNLVFEVNYKSY